MSKRERLCNQDCNNCAAIENEQLAVLLNVLALRFGEEVWHITNMVCLNMSYCPICRIDDFCHYDDDDGAFVTPIERVKEGLRTCAVATTAIKFFNKLKKEKT